MHDGETQRPRPVLITDSLRGESGYFGDLTLRYSLYLFLLFFIFLISFFFFLLFVTFFLFFFFFTYSEALPALRLRRVDIFGPPVGSALNNSQNK